MAQLQDTLKGKKVLEVFLDSSAYYKGDTLEMLESLRELFIVSGLPEIRFVCTSQSLREQANSGSLTLLTSARAATSSLSHYPEIKPNTHLSVHHANTGAAYDHYFTTACKEYQNALIDEIFPETIAEPILFIENLKSRDSGATLTDVCRKNAKELKRLTKGMLPNDQDETFSRTFRQQLQSVYTLAFTMQSQHGNNGFHELGHKPWEKLEDVRIVNPKTKRIDDPFIIQALAMHPYFWKPVSERLKDHPAKKDSADRSVLHYFTEILPRKDDVKDRMLLTITDDKKLRDSFAAYHTGNFSGNGVHALKDYRRPFAHEPEVDHFVATTLTLPGLVKHQLLTMIPAHLTDPIDGDPVVEKLISNIEAKCGAIKEYGKKRIQSDAGFKSLETPYEEILEAKQRGGVRRPS